MPSDLVLSIPLQGTLQVKVTGSRPKIVVSADGRGGVARAGARLLADVADATGLTAAFSDALAGLRARESGHDPGRVAVDLAVLLAGGILSTSGISSADVVV